jgi:signal transduction histidine kinase
MSAARDFTRGNAPMKIEIVGKDEIGELARSVNRMAEEIDRRNRYNRDFLSETMHELKAPLTAIKGAAEILEGSAAEKPDSRRKFLSNIRHDTDRMIRMVGELTRLTQLDMDVLSEKKEPVDYCGFLKRLAERVREVRMGRPPELTVSIPDGSFTVSLVPGRIEQVIDNLLENAFRYTPPDGMVELSAREGPDRTIITTVRNTGPGIAPANLEKVFDRFFTTEPKDREKPYGSGLGLAIARSIVENHGGRIWVESAPSAGAAFSFSLANVD